MQALSQLSYSPEFEEVRIIMSTPASVNHSYSAPGFATDNPA